MERVGDTDHIRANLVGYAEPDAEPGKLLIRDGKLKDDDQDQPYRFDGVCT